MTAALEIPILDLRTLNNPDRDVDEIRRIVLEAFGTFGLIYLSGHDMPRSYIDGLYREFGRFCALSDDRKREYFRPDLWMQRGYSPPNTERAVVAGGQPDFKECYFATHKGGINGLPVRYPELFAQNVWPEGFREFRMHCLMTSRRLHWAGTLLLRACALALDLPESSLSSMVRGGASITRVLRYLPLSREQIGTDILWGEEHTDFNLVTVLPGGKFYDPDGSECDKPDEGCGLYLRTRPSDEHPNGLMIQGNAPPGCMIAQVGQQLEILSGGTFIATPHIIRPPKTPGFSRMSVAHFVHTHPDTLLLPLEPFRTDDTLRMYGPGVTTGTYSVKTLVDIGLAPPEALQLLGYRQYSRLASMRRSA